MAVFDILLEFTAENIVWVLAGCTAFFAWDFSTREVNARTGNNWLYQVVGVFAGITSLVFLVRHLW